MKGQRPHYGLKARVRYWFDNQMGRGAASLILWLFITAATVIVLLSLILLLNTSQGGESISWLDALWLTFIHALDSGAIGGTSGGWLSLTVMLLATLSGLFLLSTLIGLINTGIEARLETLRRGRSRVLESDHTVILGWSPHVLTIISQLVIANESRRDACIAILAEMDKVEMEEEIKAEIPNLKTTRIVCRNGNPHEGKDLAIVSPDTARSIIIPPPDVEHPDITVIKIILALVNRKHSFNEKHSFAETHNIVTSIMDPDNLEVAKLAGGDHVKFILFEDLISRITAQTCRQSGLSVVYSELLEYDGSEFYFRKEPRLAGRPFHEALFAFEKTTVIGIFDAAKRSLINPAPDTIINPGDSLIVLATDDSEIEYTGFHKAAPINVSPPLSRPAQLPERFLFVHWNRKAIRILRELDRYVVKGSEVVVAGAETDQFSEIIEMCSGFENLTVRTSSTDPAKPRQLRTLDIRSFNHVIVLSSEQIDDLQEVDARTIAILLTLRHLLEGKMDGISIVSEMHDIQNRELAAVAEADDFIVSSHIDSLLMTQISENQDMASVFDDLFDADGAEIYLKPADQYFDGAVAAPFSAFVKLCADQRQVAIGYRHLAFAHDREKNFGVTINPPKSEIVTLGPDDRLIVIADD